MRKISLDECKWLGKMCKCLLCDGKKIFPNILTSRLYVCRQCSCALRIAPSSRREWENIHVKFSDDFSSWNRTKLWRQWTHQSCCMSLATQEIGCYVKWEDELLTPNVKYRSKDNHSGQMLFVEMMITITINLKRIIRQSFSVYSKFLST